MSTKLLIVAAVLAAGGTLAACGSSDGPAGGEASQPTSTAGTASTKLTCGVAPASLVNSALGTTVSDPVEQNLNTVVVCRYPAGSNSAAVIVRIQTDMTESVFKKARDTSDASGLPTSDLPGLADKAYTNTLKAGTHVTNTVVALKGSVQILVTSPASFDAEASLARQLFDKILDS